MQENRKNGRTKLKERCLVEEIRKFRMKIVALQETPFKDNRVVVLVDRQLLIKIGCQTRNFETCFIVGLNLKEKGIHFQETSARI